MDSSPEDRLDVILRAYSTARDRQDQDMAEAGSDAEADAIRANLAALQLAYLKAENARLDARGPAVEAAYGAATSAADEIARAYRQGAALAGRIRAVAGAATAAANLVTKAADLA